MTKLTRRSVAAGLAATPIALATSAQAATTHKVSILGMAFRPDTLTIKAGDTVRWTNDDDVPHTATDKGRSWNTGTLSANRGKSITFDTAGNFDYFCKIHTNMKGRITVE